MYLLDTNIWLERLLDQHRCAELSNLQIVSFDGDFDRNDSGRKSPSQVLNS